ncbi:AbrB family transcriptional regulator [Tabrizicola sp. TH137]|nr:AbrB family transcriptional regulator [Tabrizicola sp. TH137]
MPSLKDTRNLPGRIRGHRVTSLARIVAGLSIGGLGGCVFHLLSMPLPWMLGALTATMATSVAGWPIRGPDRLRPVIVAVIGVLLGSRFTPGIIEQAGEMLTSLAILLAYLVAVGGVIVSYFRLVGRQDWTTAYFAGMPGGLSEMVELGEARGANVPVIVLAHSLRIVLTIALMAILFRLVLGHDVGTGPVKLDAAIGPVDAALLIACAVIGMPLGRLLRLPAPTFLGPLILSAAVHMAGLTASVPPLLLVNAAQVALGTILGCRFLGISVPTLARACALNLGATLITLTFALGGALAMQQLAGVRLDQGFLALAPGGLTEMGLIALAIQADVAFVALHHVIRILAVIVVAPLLLRQR